MKRVTLEESLNALEREARRRGIRERELQECVALLDDHAEQTEQPQRERIKLRIALAMNIQLTPFRLGLSGTIHEA